MSKTSEMTICHVNKIREVNKTSTCNPTFHSPLAQLTTVLSYEMKCAIILFIFYTPAVVKTYKELYIIKCSACHKLVECTKIGPKGLNGTNPA